MDDLDQIGQLKARYFRFLDTQDWDGLASVFTPDAIVDMTHVGGARTTSFAEFLAGLQRALDGAVTVHHGHMPEITLTSPTSAHGIWAMEDRIWWPEGSPIRRLHGYGHYDETYVKADGGWRIATMTLTRLRRDLES